MERLFLELDLQRAALSATANSKFSSSKRNRPDESEISDMIKKTRYEAASNGGGANNNLPQQKTSGFALPSATLAALNAVAAQVDNVPDVNDRSNGSPAPSPLLPTHSVPTMGPAATAAAAAAQAAAAAAQHALQQQQQQTDESDANAAPSAPLTADQIKMMMENAKMMIAQKKAAAGIGRAVTPTPVLVSPDPHQRPFSNPRAPPRSMFPTGGTMGGTIPTMPTIIPTSEEEPDLPIPSGRSKLINAEEQVSCLK